MVEPFQRLQWIRLLLIKELTSAASLNGAGKTATLLWSHQYSGVVHLYDWLIVVPRAVFVGRRVDTFPFVAQCRVPGTPVSAFNLLFTLNANKSTYMPTCVSLFMYYIAGSLRLQVNKGWAGVFSQSYNISKLEFI